MEVISKCPVCSSERFSEFLICKDYSVSGKNFPISQCQDCGFKFTNPRPAAEEIGAYYESEDYISHSNTSKGFINQLYQLARKYTIYQKVNLVKREILRLKKGVGLPVLDAIKTNASPSAEASVNNLTYDNSKIKILDIGCGTGEFLKSCKETGFDSIGVEPSQKARSFAIQTYNLKVKEEKEISSLEKESFDAITMWHVLEHVPNLNERINQVFSLLKKDGVFIVAVPNLESKDAKEYGKYWAAYDVPRHLYHFSFSTIEKLMDKHNFVLYKTLPMFLDSFYVSLLSEKYKTGSVNYVSAFFNGTMSNLAALMGNRGYSSQIYLLKKK
jgi:2-polyprenyl-3-methyl-5-hydroxy-6-metoxy-1,4-benzoquinol methylase